ncbi:TerD family protein [Streptomyces sp. NPDC052299]|uniref:TerD family protein n=1 Tax=Streptomyces sp. NPDC052299 TaxID=3155054 RepID=UPI00342DC6E0
MTGIGTGLRKPEVKLKWDPSSWTEPARHLDIVAATYTQDTPHDTPANVVHTESRSPDGTITMLRHSETGLGLGFVEIMQLDLDRMHPSYGRIVVGVVIHQAAGRRIFGDITHAGVVIVDGYTELLADDFAQVADATAATVAEFVRDRDGQWQLHERVQGFDSDPTSFPYEMGKNTDA